MKRLSHPCDRVSPARIHRPGLTGPIRRGVYPSKKVAHRAPCGRRSWISTRRAGSDYLGATCVKDTCPGGPTGDLRTAGIVSPPGVTPAATILSYPIGLWLRLPWLLPVAALAMTLDALRIVPGRAARLRALRRSRTSQRRSKRRNAGQSATSPTRVALLRSQCQQRVHARGAPHG